MNDYREVQSYLSHSKKKSSAGMPTNIPKQRKNPNNIPSSVRNSRIREALSALQKYTNDPYVKDPEMHNNLASGARNANDKESHGRENGNYVTSYGPGGNAINKEHNRLTERADKKNKEARSAVNSLLSSGVLSNEETLRLKSILKSNDMAVTNDSFSRYYVSSIMSYLESFLKHDNITDYLSHASDAFNRKRKDIPVSGMPTSAAAKAGFKGTTGTINNHVSTAEKTASRRVYDPNTGTFKDSGTSITDKMVQNADRQQIINRATAMNNTTNKILHSVQNNNQLGQLKELKSMIAAYNQKYGAKLRLKERSVVSAGWDNKLFTMEVI